jgi:hypothetical protein
MRPTPARLRSYLLQPSLASARVPVATIERPPVYGFYARGVSGGAAGLM